MHALAIFQENLFPGANKKFVLRKSLLVTTKMVLSVLSHLLEGKGSLHGHLSSTRVNEALAYIKVLTRQIIE